MKSSQEQIAMMQPWEISTDSVKIYQPLDDSVTLKVVSIEEVPQAQLEAELADEVPHLWRCKGREELQDSWLFVMERVQNKLADEFITSGPTEKELYRHAIVLIDTCAELQQRGLIVRNLSAQNVLLVGEGEKEVRVFHTTNFTEANEIQESVRALGNTLANLSVVFQPVDPDQWTENWRELLRALCEGECADFIELRKQYCCFMDDEPFSKFNPPEVEMPKTTLEINMICGLKFVRISPSYSERIPCLMTLKAPRVSNRMYSIDLVYIIDVSGSMEGDPLNMMQECFFKLLEKMDEHDRVSIVTFSTEAERKCPLIACSEEGKVRLTKVVESLVPDDLTNLEAGLVTGLDVLRQRRLKNTVTAIVLFTDGHSNTEFSEKLCFSLMSQVDNLVVECLGLGEHLDDDHLLGIAEKSNGTYHIVMKPEELSMAFEKIFKELLYQTAQDVNISFAEARSQVVSCRLEKVFLKHESNIVRIPYIAEDTEKGIVFFIKPVMMELASACRSEPVTAHISYKDCEGTHTEKSINLSISFVPRQDSEPGQVEKVYVHWFRVRIAETLERVRRNRETEEAKKTINELVECIEASKHSANKDLVAMKDELRKLLPEFPESVKNANRHIALLSYSLMNQKDSCRGRDNPMIPASPQTTPSRISTSRRSLSPLSVDASASALSTDR